LKQKASPFETMILGGLNGDPGLFVQVKKSGLHLLFDVGDVSTLTKKQMVRTQHIFVTHTHMDHFMDFDRLVRVKVAIKKPIYVYGPPGIIDQISHKLLAYTWNLIDDDQLSFIVTEINSAKSLLTIADVSKKYGFLPANRRQESMQDFIIKTLDDHSIIRAVNLNHRGIDSIAYQLEYPGSTKVDTKSLKSMSLNPGPWISELQLYALKGELDKTIKIAETTFSVKELSEEILAPVAPYKLVYITDIGFEADNIDKIFLAFKETDSIVCESSFSDADIDRATDKAHLTSHQAAYIARGLKTKDFNVFHISNIYADDVERVEREAFEQFRKLEQISDESFKRELQKKLSVTIRD
jgi:ribonuclease Z